MADTSRMRFVHDAIGATAVLACFYALAYVLAFAPLQLPGYVLVVGFGLVTAVLEPVGAGGDVVLAAYLVGLGLASAAVSHVVRRSVSAGHLAGLRVVVASALALVGVLSLAFALAILLGTSQWEPVVLTTAIGLLLLGIAGWLAGAFELALPRDD